MKLHNLGNNDSTVLYTVYTMPNCPDCKNAKDLLAREDKPYLEIASFTPEELIAVVGPVRTLPQILVTDNGNHDHAGTYHIGGYKDLVKVMGGDISGLRKIA